MGTKSKLHPLGYLALMQPSGVQAVVGKPRHNLCLMPQVAFSTHMHGHAHMHADVTPAHLPPGPTPDPHTSTPSTTPGLTWKMSWKARMSCAASSSCRQSSPLLTMTGRRFHPLRLPWGLCFCTLAALAVNLQEAMVGWVMLGSVIHSWHPWPVSKSQCSEAQEGGRKTLCRISRGTGPNGSKWPITPVPQMNGASA